ncbi:MAG: Long chain acyl-CoA dehydrogenase [fadN-fadA-fadE operon], partial [uncultured Ramlibacter sp.]
EGLPHRQRAHRHQRLHAGLRRPRLHQGMGHGAVRAGQPHQHDLRGHEHGAVAGPAGPQGAGQPGRDAQEVRQTGGAAGGRGGREREDGRVHQPDRDAGRPDDQVHHRARLQGFPEPRRGGRRRGGLPARAGTLGVRLLLGAHGASCVARNRGRQPGSVLQSQAADRPLLLCQAVPGDGDADAHGAVGRQGAAGYRRGVGV